MEVMEMKKNLALRNVSVFLFLAVLIFVFSADAEAATRRFGTVSVDVPDGWTVEETDDMLAFMAPDQSALFSVMLETLDGITFKEFAEGVVGQLNGSVLEEAPHMLAFSFKNEHGIDSEAILAQNRNNPNLVTMMIKVGEHPQLEGMINSFTWLD